MALEERRPSRTVSREAERIALSQQWHRLSMAATWVAVITSPLVFLWLYRIADMDLKYAIPLTIVMIAAFRGLVDILFHKAIPRASMYDAGQDLLAQDVVDRRRLSFWRSKYRLAFALVVLFSLYCLVGWFLFGSSIGHQWDNITGIFGGSGSSSGVSTSTGAALPLFFVFNFLILMGPMLVMGIRQMKGYEPGDADWGVKLDDIRGQKEQKAEVTRVISLWQAGDDFRKAGGKPERGLLFLGAPGTGKTMLSKGIATSFNSPIVTMPGSAFAQTFIGMDVIIVQFLIGKARRLARKWGGQCIIFIDEIDAVGLRRQALGREELSASESAYYGEMGTLAPGGDLVLETEAWREHIFREREPEAPLRYPGPYVGAANRIANFIGGMGGMGGMGSGALNQLLVQMDGVDEPPFLRKFLTRQVNTYLDAVYFIPYKLGKVRLRLKPAKPRKEEIYFIGATNVPVSRLDPALTRPGRMGRHIWFKTPDLKARKDIFDVYLKKVAHVEELDTDAMRSQLARITGGYSPAMIEQCCSMALTYAHSDDRAEFGWMDIVEAITTIESGTAQDGDYNRPESRATAIHEAGHAIASHLYHENMESTRLSIRPRGSSGGHHQAREIEEREFKFRHSLVGKLVWYVGALAAEHVFFGENSTGVGGDLQMTTRTASEMVAASGLGPEPVNLRGRVPDDELEEREREVMQRFERIGMQLMNRTSNAVQSEGATSSLMDPFKRRAAATLIGQAYLTALVCMQHNREAVSQVAQVLTERHELYGDEVVDLLNAVGLERPTIDLLDESIWPRLA